MSVLLKTKTYLIGPMQYAEDSGTQWRKYISGELNTLGITCYDPTIPMFTDDLDEVNSKSTRLQMMKDGNYDEVASQMKRVRTHDLSLVDRTDFIYCYIDPKIPSLGTDEEFVTANRMKKPIFVVVEGGKKNSPLWLMGQIPHKYIFDYHELAIDKIKQIDNNEIKIDSSRWRLLLPELR